MSNLGSLGETEDVLGQAAAWRAAGEDVALATVTETWGSSPRPAGSQMAVTTSGKMAGSVSGGCIEGAVADAAMRTIASGTPAAPGFRRDQRARLGGRTCLRRQGEGVRGEADVTPEILAALGRAREEKRAVVLATRLSDGAQHLLPDPAQDAALNEAATVALRDDESRTDPGRGRRLVPSGA